MVNLQYKCVWMSAACKGSISAVCRIIETCRLATLCGGCVTEEKPKLSSFIEL